MMKRILKASYLAAMLAGALGAAPLDVPLSSYPATNQFGTNVEFYAVIHIGTTNVRSVRLSGAALAQHLATNGVLIAAFQGAGSGASNAVVRFQNNTNAFQWLAIGSVAGADFTWTTNGVGQHATNTLNVPADVIFASEIDTVAELNTILSNYLVTSNAVRQGNVVYLDAVRGDDVTGIRGSLIFPFAGLTNAVHAAAAGDTVYGHPGTYTVGTNTTSLLKPMVNLYFAPGVQLNFNNAADGAARPIFTDTDITAGTTNLIMGYADMTSSNAMSYLVEVTKAHSKVFLQANVLRRQHTSTSFSVLKHVAGDFVWHVVGITNAGYDGYWGIPTVTNGFRVEGTADWIDVADTPIEFSTGAHPGRAHIRVGLARGRNIAIGSNVVVTAGTVAIEELSSTAGIASHADPGILNASWIRPYTNTFRVLMDSDADPLRINNARIYGGSSGTPIVFTDIGGAASTLTLANCQIVAGGTYFAEEDEIIPGTGTPAIRIVGTFSANKGVNGVTMYGLWVAQEMAASNGDVLRYRPAVGWTNESISGLGLGDFVGPASATDSAVVLFDSTTGKLGKNSGVIVNSTNGMSVPGGVAVHQLKSSNLVEVLGNGSTGGGWELFESNQTHSITIRAADQLAGSQSLILYSNALANAAVGVLVGTNQNGSNIHVGVRLITGTGHLVASNGPTLNNLTDIGTATFAAAVFNAAATFLDGIDVAGASTFAQAVLVDSLRSTNAIRGDSTLTLSGQASLDSARITNAFRADGAATFGSTSRFNTVQVTNASQLDGLATAATGVQMASGQVTNNTTYILTTLNVMTNSTVNSNLTVNVNQAVLDLNLTNNISITNFTGLTADTSKTVTWWLRPRLVNRTIVYPTLGAPGHAVYWRTNANAPLWTTLTNSRLYALSMEWRNTNVIASVTDWGAAD